MIRLIILLISVTCSFSLNKVKAQGGGPPMNTDDPAVVDYHTWEINSSINTSVTNETQLELPSLDINYGIAHNFHFNIENSYVLIINKQRRASGSFSDVSIGLKYHFLKKKSIISAGVFPHFILTGNNKGILLPLLLAKAFGKFVVNANAGIFWGNHNNQSFQEGILFAYSISDKFEVMAEYFMENAYKPLINTGYMNYGCRYSLNKTFTLMGSIGTQLITPVAEQKVYLFAYLGIQTSL